MATWCMWYTDEGFLVWIIPFTYLSRESIIWACTTSFVHARIYRMFNLFTACTYALYTAFFYTWFTVILLIYLMLFVITCTCILGPRHLIMYTCTCYARHLALYMYCGLHLPTLNSHVQILETGPWWPYWSRSECAADPPVVIRVQQKLRRRRSSSFQLFSCLALEVPLAHREHLSVFVYLFMYYVLFFIFCWCNISVILYRFLW